MNIQTRYSKIFKIFTFAKYLPFILFCHFASANSWHKTIINDIGYGIFIKGGNQSNWINCNGYYSYNNDGVVLKPHSSNMCEIVTSQTDTTQYEVKYSCRLDSIQHFSIQAVKDSFSIGDYLKFLLANGAYIRGHNDVEWPQLKFVLTNHFLETQMTGFSQSDVTTFNQISTLPCLCTPLSELNPKPLSPIQ